MDSATLSPPALPLTSRHLEELRESGLTDETIRASGVFSSPPGPLRKILNWPSPTRNWGGGLVFPYRDSSGYPTGLCRVKPDRPPKGKNGKPAKYLQPVGAAVQPYFTRRPLGGIKIDSRYLVCICEGEKKALAVCQSGIPCIGLSGIWNWQKPRVRGENGKGKGERTMLSELAALDWSDKVVSVAFDTDDRRSPNVNHAAAELARVLTEHGAEVAFARFPVIVDGSGEFLKTGADDFMVWANEVLTG